MTQPSPPHATLHRLLHPASIAVVGASMREGAFGARVLENLTGYGGSIWPVNPRYAELGGRRCYPSLADLPGAPDCVAIATPREGVAAVLRDCVAAGAGGAVVFAAGYSETGLPDRVAEQAELAAWAARLPLLGPNCLGFGNFLLGAGVTFSAGPKPVVPQGAAVGIVSQSGALGFALAQAVERGIAISHVLTSGNAAGLDTADLAAFLAEEPGCAAIACVLEGLAEPRRLLAAAALAARAGKPLLVHKMASGQEGAAAALSHTGAIAGSHAVWRAALAEAGAVLVEDFSALMEMAAFFAKAPAAPRAPGVAVVSTSGGAGILAADAAERHGVPLPQPGAVAAAVLAARIPEYGSARNPCDLTAQVLNDAGALVACTDALAADPGFGALLYPNTHAYPFSANRIPVMAEIAARHGGFLCVPWLAEAREGEVARMAQAVSGAAIFSSTDRCFAALSAWQRRAARAARPAEQPSRFLDKAALDHARRLLDAAPGPVMTESAATAVLAACGLSVAGGRLVQDLDAALAAAEALDYPVVLKAESPDLPHKTEAGAVRLDLRDAAALRQAHAAMLDALAALPSPPRLSGLLVQPMLPRGVEVMVGARQDPVFGPVVAVGLGGVLVELLSDMAVAPAPVSLPQARRMLYGLRGFPLLTGFRGMPAADLDELAETICRVAELAAALPGRIAELDINPLVCAGKRIVAVDALIALEPAAKAMDEAAVIS
ncbi:acetate--CoA ligase family protein [Roseomonas marmotae]|uniref:Acetate--CoA ligase family protein n=1 Tax=Roseomonas marmotae TaxID=2768161 RepID=A0ABS3KHA9_9PROT|nr:acetate--CoA ligase family protein [Roseomonas marmotae]MBO1076855.1 acetate--CoA ligase family protein [Roseomonas marmotae]QTI81191.1 acetate--CoA ligase family protein [Roseomonas marmotae]